MSDGSDRDYFFSIEPFWPAGDLSEPLSTPTGEISVSVFHWDVDDLCCVPGNGQVGVMFCGPENFSGTCYGVLPEQMAIPLYGRKEGEFIRFSPGSFSQIFGIPASLISPAGTPMENVFSPEQMAKLRDTTADPDPQRALLTLVGHWEEDAWTRPGSQQSQLAKQVARLIWKTRGQMRLRDLENEVTYSGRHLQNVVGRNVGVSPKQLSRQTRFQNALLLLRAHPDVNLAWAAQTLGYSDQSHFCREFRQFCGMSPQQFLQYLLAAREKGEGRWSS